VSAPSRMIANARMYATSPRVAAAWRTLLEWVIERAGVACEVVDYPPPQPLAALWARADLGCAFMCGYPLARASKPPSVLAAPVPSPPAYGGKPIYWTNLVVRADSPLTRLTDAFGQRIAYTSVDSQSGYQAVRALFAPYARAKRGPLFASTIGPLVTPRAIIEAVLDGTADVGPLDSYCHELVRADEPEIAAQLRTVAATAPTPIPPLIAARMIAAADASRLSAALLAVADAPELAPARATLLLDGFVARTASNYAVLTARADEADALGYPTLA